jgi:Zn-finger nucleic acid-binding protein
MMFAGAKFCSHCGAQGNRSEVTSAEVQLCPRCKAGMKAVTVGTTNLLECSLCEGIWVGVEALQKICAERERQAAVLGMPKHPEEPLQLEKKIQYIPCPVCHQLMNRINFAHCSHVIVDVCQAHGTWFDKDELRRTVEFIRAGGLEKARAQQLDDIRDERRRLESIKNSSLGVNIFPAAIQDRSSDTSCRALDLLLDLLN